MSPRRSSSASSDPVPRAGSPSVERAVQILDFLTTHPGRGFTLSELSRRLRISKTTAHGVLATLSDRALVQRHPDTGEYRLGPALIPMGAVAERAFPALTHARCEADRLAAQFDCECVIVQATADELLLIGRAGIPGPMSITSHEGQRHPLTPPLGSTVIAWTDDGTIDAWLDRLGPTLTVAERERYRTALGAIRRQGYAAGIRVPQLVELAQLYADADLYSPEGRREVSHAMAAVAHEDNYLRPTDDLPPDAELSSVAAPVFGSDATMVLTIALMPQRCHVSDLPDLSRAVIRAAGRVMAAIDGRHPTIANQRS